MPVTGPNLAPLDSFRAIRPVTFLSFAPLRVLEQGLRLIDLRQIEKIEANPEGHLEASFVGKPDAKTFLAVHGESVQARCNCPESKAHDVCKHQAALFGLVMALVNGRFPGGKVLNPSLASYYHKLLMDHASEQGGDEAVDNVEDKGEGAPELILTRRHGLCFTWKSELPRAFWQSLGPLGNYRTWAQIPLQLDPAGALKQVFSAAKAFQIPIFYQPSEGGSVRITQLITQGVQALAIHHSRDEKVNIGTFHKIHGKPIPDCELVELANQVYLWHPDKIVLFSEGPWNRLATDFLPHMKFAPRDVPLEGIIRWERSIEPAYFASFAALPPGETPPGLRDVHFYAGDDEVAAPEVESIATLALQISLRKSEAKGDHFELKLESELEGTTLDLTPVVAPLLRAHIGSGHGSQALARSRKRTVILAKIALRLHSIARVQEAKAFIRDALAEAADSFPTTLVRHARRVLEAYHRDFTSPAVADRVTLLPYGRAPFWRVARLPIAALARLTLLITEGGMQEPGCGQLPSVPARTAGEFLRRISAMTRRLSVTVTVQGEPLLSDRLEARVDLLEKPEFDWFELRPEVRCGALRIPQSEWEALIRGELVRTAQGEWIAPTEEQIAPLRKMVELMNNRKGASKGASKETAKPLLAIPKLAIFDWLELRKNGVSLTLPTEIATMVESLQSLTSLPQTPVSKEFAADLRDYQKQGYDWISFLYTHHFGACLADDMGLGKTLQALAFLEGLRSGNIPRQNGVRENTSSLVVLPPSLLFNWASEAAKFAPKLRVAEHAGNRRDLSDAERADVVLTTYDILRRDLSAFRMRSWHVLVLDEAQLLKNHTAARTKAVQALPRAFTLCLTGTPMENHVREYLTLLSLAVPGLLPSGGGSKDSPPIGDPTLLARARPFVLRRTKTQILTELPPKVEQDIYLDMSEEQKEIYTRTVGEVRAEVLKAYSNKPKAQAGIVAITALTRLRQVCISPALFGKASQSSPKFEYLLERMVELHEQRHAALIFSQFTSALDLIQPLLVEAGLPTLRLDGSTPAARRRDLVKTFQDDPDHFFFLISLKAGGVGLNLTRSNYVFHLDPWWNPAVENQASDRAHRIGQTQRVFVQRLVMRHTVEESMMKLKAVKRARFDALLETNALTSAGAVKLDRDDFLGLLE